MAEITSSSVISSAIPAKLVSRRSIRIARFFSALPRNAPTNCRRSVSFNGRKSIRVLLPGVKGQNETFPFLAKSGTSPPVKNCLGGNTAEVVVSRQGTNAPEGAEAIAGHVGRERQAPRLPLRTTKLEQ